jgi:RNA polymerase sigma factor (sigma-70 family)
MINILCLASLTKHAVESSHDLTSPAANGRIHRTGGPRRRGASGTGTYGEHLVARQRFAPILMGPDPAGQRQAPARTWRAPKAVQEGAQSRGSVLVNPCALAAKSASRREHLIMENIEHVHSIEKRLQQRVQCVLIEDLVGAGTVGLIQAVDRFDSSLEARFRSYASHRILGAMLDYLREQDPIGRDERRRMRTVEGATGLTAHTQPSTVSLDGLSARALNTALGQSATRSPDVILRAELNEGRQALLPPGAPGDHVAL